MTTLIIKMPSHDLTSNINAYIRRKEQKREVVVIHVELTGGGHISTSSLTQAEEIAKTHNIGRVIILGAHSNKPGGSNFISRSSMASDQVIPAVHVAPLITKALKPEQQATSIRVLSCYSAHQGDSIARALAAELQQPVIGFDSELGFHANGRFVPLPAITPLREEQYQLEDKIAELKQQLHDTYMQDPTFARVSNLVDQGHEEPRELSRIKHQLLKENPAIKSLHDRIDELKLKLGIIHVKRTEHLSDSEKLTSEERREEKLKDHRIFQPADKFQPQPVSPASSGAASIDESLIPLTATLTPTSLGGSPIATSPSPSQEESISPTGATVRAAPEKESAPEEAPITTSAAGAAPVEPQEEEEEWWGGMTDGFKNS